MARASISAYVQVRPSANTAGLAACRWASSAKRSSRRTSVAQDSRGSSPTMSWADRWRSAIGAPCRSTAAWSWRSRALESCIAPTQLCNERNGRPAVRGHIVVGVHRLGVWCSAPWRDAPHLIDPARAAARVVTCSAAVKPHVVALEPLLRPRRYPYFSSLTLEDGSIETALWQTRHSARPLGTFRARDTPSNCGRTGEHDERMTGAASNLDYDAKAAPESRGRRPLDVRG